MVNHPMRVLALLPAKHFTARKVHAYYDTGKDDEGCHPETHGWHVDFEEMCTAGLVHKLLLSLSVLGSIATHCDSTVGDFARRRVIPDVGEQKMKKSSNDGVVCRDD